MNIPRSKLLSLTGWGNYPRESSPSYRPEKSHELLQVVRSAPEPSLISRGFGRSYGDAALNGADGGTRGGGVILHTRLCRMIAFDSSTGLLEAEAGVSLADILTTFVPRGWFLPVTPGTKFVTLGGAVAADVHGKNHHRDGSFSEFVTAIQLLSATGNVLNCSREENADIFRATIGGLGLTGAILRVTMRLLPVQSAHIKVDYERAADLDAALSLFGTGDDRYHYSVAWIDCLASGSSLGRSVLIRGNHAPIDELPLKLRNAPLEFRAPRTKHVPVYMPSWILNARSVKLFNSLFYRKHHTTSKIINYDKFFYPLDRLSHWNRMYGRRGFVQYQALFPHATARAGLIELLERLSQSRRASFLAVLKTMGKASDGLISFPYPGQTLALDLPNTGPDLLTFLDELDGIVIKHGGRVYLAKDSRTSPSAVSTMYPALADFKRIKARLDPANRFSSSLARRLKFTEHA